MMGISISDIKDIFAGKANLKTTVSQRLRELETEEQNIATVKNLCHTVLEYDMEVHMLNEELLTENAELWKQKLFDINLEEKANYMNRKVCIVLCILSILLCFSPLIPVDDKMLNIVQIFLYDSYHLNTELLITAAMYLTVPVIYVYLLHCYIHYKNSVIFMDSTGIIMRVAPALLSSLNILMISCCGLELTSSPHLVMCILLTLLRMLIGFFLLICYASGDELFLLLLKSKKQ